MLRAVALLAIVTMQAALIAPDAMAQNDLLPPEVASGNAAFITNKWSHGRLAVDQNGKLYESDPNALDPNASWELQTVEGSPGVYKIRSRLYGRYLLMDNNDLKTGKVLIGGPNDGPYAHWIFEPAQGSLRIRNAGNPDFAINNQDGSQRGPVKVSFVDEGWHSAMWDFRALNEQEKAERAALIIRHDNVPLTGIWRQVSSDFYPCPECRLGILASRNRRVDQEGPGG
ncbi:MAG: RICIN domain-containing protein, partial [Rhodobiaceae bacterium]|nr:RICIN domain-containing protein [Rhodobiaceae bacterium]